MLEKYNELKTTDKFFVVIFLINAINFLMKIAFKLPEGSIAVFMSDYIIICAFLILSIKTKYNSVNMSFFRGNGISVIKSKAVHIIAISFGLSLFMFPKFFIEKDFTYHFWINLIFIFLMSINLYNDSYKSHICLLFGLVPLLSAIYGYEVAFVFAALVSTGVLIATVIDNRVDRV